MKKTPSSYLAGILMAVVVVAIACAFAGSCIRRARVMSLTTATISNARMMFTLLLAERLDRYEKGTPAVFPSPDGPDKTSTEYFQRQMDAGIFGDIEANLFSAPGCVYARGRTITSESNAWCINASITNGSPPDTPALFTRNLHFTNTSGKVTAFLSDDYPFGKRSAVVVAIGGSTMRIAPPDLPRLAATLQPEQVAHILRP